MKRVSRDGKDINRHVYRFPPPNTSSQFEDALALIDVKCRVIVTNTTEDYQVSNKQTGVKISFKGFYLSLKQKSKTV